MSDKSISPLRQRMIDDMTARRYSEKAQKAYVLHVSTFAAVLGRSPDATTSDDLRSAIAGRRNPEAGEGVSGFSRPSFCRSAVTGVPTFCSITASAGSLFHRPDRARPAPLPVRDTPGNCASGAHYRTAKTLRPLFWAADRP
jgi:hypothetical protein